MQPIERVGVFALLLLVVTVVAVVLWDHEPESLVPGTTIAAKEKPIPVARPESKPKASVPTVPSRSVTPTPTVPVAPAARPLTAPPAARTKPDDDDAKSRRAPANRPEAPSASPAFERPARPESDSDRPAGPALASSKTPAKQPDKAVASAPGGTYTVKKGDVLGTIALVTLGTSTRWKEIADLNPDVDPSRLAVGTVLRLPGGASAPPSGASAARGTDAPKSGGSYTIRSGDSLWVIAARELGDGSRWSEIAQLNPTLDPDKLIVGRKITLPAGRSSSPSVAVARNTQPASGSPKTGVVR
jgi:nucleoid-associated protein YgaU